MLMDPTGRTASWRRKIRRKAVAADTKKEMRAYKET